MAREGNKNRNSYIIAGIVLAIALVYYFFFRTPPVDDFLLSSSSVETSRVPGQQLIILLDELERLQLDGAVLTSPAFTSLEDFGVDIVPEPVGRNNPFAPIGVE